MKIRDSRDPYWIGDLSEDRNKLRLCLLRSKGWVDHLSERDGQTLLGWRGMVGDNLEAVLAEMCLSGIPVISHELACVEVFKLFGRCAARRLRDSITGKGSDDGESLLGFRCDPTFEVWSRFKVLKRFFAYKHRHESLTKDEIRDLAVGVIRGDWRRRGRYCRCLPRCSSRYGRSHKAKGPCGYDKIVDSVVDLSLREDNRNFEVGKKVWLLGTLDGSGLALPLKLRRHRIRICIYEIPGTPGYPAKIELGLESPKGETIPSDCVDTVIQHFAATLTAMMQAARVVPVGLAGKMKGTPVGTRAWGRGAAVAAGLLDSFTAAAVSRLGDNAKAKDLMPYLVMHLGRGLSIKKCSGYLNKAGWRRIAGTQEWAAPVDGQMRAGY